MVALAGVACTAGLATDRPRRGPHHAHVALQTAAHTATWSLDLEKGRRSRGEEERLVARLVLNAVADAYGVPLRLDLDLFPGDEVRHTETLAPQPWQDLMLGRTAAVCHQGDGGPVAAVFPGAFNPLHAGHRRMIEIAHEHLGRAGGGRDFDPQRGQAAAGLYGDRAPRGPVPAAAGDLAHAGGDVRGEVAGVSAGRVFRGHRHAPPHRRLGVLSGGPPGVPGGLGRIAARGCRFLVFGRTVGKTLLRLADLELPDFFRDTCREVPPERFCQDVSSTAIRKRGKA